VDAFFPLDKLRVKIIDIFLETLKEEKMWILDIFADSVSS
jgi:hypothetical protein